MTQVKKICLVFSKGTFICQSILRCRLSASVLSGKFTLRWNKTVRQGSENWIWSLERLRLHLTLANTRCALTISISSVRSNIHVGLETTLQRVIFQLIFLFQTTGLVL